MANGEPHSFAPALAGMLARPDYKPGYYLSRQDLLTNQSYLLQRLRRHNRYLHGWGVVCGLLVVPARDPRKPWAVQVCPGYAIGPYADEIEVQTPALVDVRDYLWRRPPDAAAVRVAYVGIRYAEQQVRPVPTRPPGCRCEETVYESSRIQDDFQVDVLWQLPEPADAEGFDVCEPGLAPCPECPESPYVILARINLPASEGDPITRDRIDNFLRRQLFSTTALQEQLIACCCREEPPPTLSADLRIAKELLSEVVLGGGVVRTYAITVTNQGPSIALNVIVEDDFSLLPEGTQASDFQTTHGAWTQTWPDRPFRASLGQLEPSQMATLSFSVFFPGGVTSENTATVRSDIPDPDISNNQVTV